MIASVLLVLSAISADPGDVDTFLKEFTAKREGVVALDAEFSQRNVLPDEKIETEGTLLFVHPRRILFHTNDPDRTTLVDDRRGYEYDAEIKQLQIFDIEDNPQADIFFLGFSSNTDNLRKAYDLSLFTTSDDPRGARGLTIRPKQDSKEQAYFLEVQIYLRDEDYLPYRIHIMNDKESEVFIDVKSINKEVRPSPQMTQIFLPEHTKVVDNDRVVETVGPGGKRIPDALLLPPDMSGTAAPAPAAVPATSAAPAAPEQAPVTEKAADSKADAKPAKAAAPTKAKAKAKTSSKKASSNKAKGKS